MRVEALPTPSRCSRIRLRLPTMRRALGRMRACTATPASANTVGRSRRCVAPRLLLAFVALLAGLAQAEAQTTVKMVGNGTDSLTYSYLGTNFDGDYRELAQRFTTGSNTAGYTLSTAAIWFGALPTNAADITNFVAAIYTSTSNRPGTLKYTLSNPSGNFATTGRKDFSAPADSTLDAGTKYWLVLMNDNATDGENVTANSTASEKDTDSLAGWSIQNQRFQRTSRSGSWSSSASQLQIRISGYENTFTNSAPIFDDGSDTSREFNETIGDATVATATNVGTAVSATDTDTTDTLEYSLGGTDAGKFGIVETTGQIQTKVGEKYSYETDTSYAVTVTVGDGNGGSDSIDVTLDVADQSEPPLLPEAPDVTGHNDVTKLLVTLTRPDNADRPNISGYQLRIRRPGISWSELEWKSHLDRTIAGANSGTRFEVQYRARNDEGEGPWSPSGFGSTRAHATGAPDITGTAEVGQTLTAGTSGISDGNGKSKAENGDVGFAYTYQWVRRVSGTDSDISGATSSTYTLTAADEGNKVKVKASFTDNAGYEEGPLTSSAYPSSGTVLEQIPTVTITADKTSAVFKEEGITYTLTRTAPTIDALDVTVTLTQDKDFLATADLGKTVTIAAGQSTKTFRVAASGFQQFAAGTPVEGGTLTAEVQDGADYDVETPASVEVAIVIGVMVRLDMASYSVGEAAGTVSIKLIARTGPGAPQPSSATSVIERVTEDGTAIKDSDFMFTNSGVEFETAGFSADGSVWKAQKTFAVSITDDEDDEDDETFNVTIRHGPGTVSVSLVDAMGNSCGNECTAAITIIDNDTPLPALSFSNIVTVDEDDGPAEQRVGLTPASSETVTVDFATRDRVGGATAGEDYTATSGTLTFTPGQTSKTITIPILDDDVYEKDIELLVVDLSNPTGATLPHPPSRSVDIHSEDAVPTASMADVTVDEGAGTMTLSLRLSHPSDEDIGYFTSFEADNDEGTATAGEDYDDFRMEPGVGRTAIITVPARNLSQTFDITLVDDGLEEPDETIKILWYKNVTSEVTPASLDFIGTIEDNDEGAGAAMGKPKIAGRAEVGQTLTVSTSAITDQHGNTKAENGEAGYAYTYQWYRLDAGAETPIAGARGRGNTYTLVQADEGKQFAVEVRFTDDVGNSEGPLKSNEYPPNAANGELRLEDGPTENVGRLEVFHNGEWGTVCDDQFDERVDDPGTLHDRRRFPNIAPRKACQFMGYANGQMIPRGNMSVAPASKKIWLDDVRCLAGSNHWTGAPPEKLHHCYHAGWSNNNCTHVEDVHLSCTGGTLNQTEATALTATLQDFPTNHDGSGAFTFRIAFSADVTISPQDMKDHALTVAGGTVTNATRVDGRSDLWELTVDACGDGCGIDPGAAGPGVHGDGRALHGGRAGAVDGSRAQRAGSGAGAAGAGPAGAGAARGGLRVGAAGA